MLITESSNELFSSLTLSRESWDSYHTVLIPSVVTFCFLLFLLQFLLWWLNSWSFVLADPSARCINILPTSAIHWNSLEVVTLQLLIFSIGNDTQFFPGFNCNKTSAAIDGDTKSTSNKWWIFSFILYVIPISLLFHQSGRMVWRS